MITPLSLLMLLTLATSALCQPVPASRVAAVEEGVLRWQDDHSEVALLGVNYYVPFSIDHYVLKQRGLDHEACIRQDVAQFERLGLTAIRLHCWDRQISDHDGNLRDNEYLQLLDYLIYQCQLRGIYSVMTPIAWWGLWGSDMGSGGGFSDLYSMAQMISDPVAREAQRNYLRQYLNHVNRYTGKAYKDDPAIVAIELINEPIPAPGTSDEAVTEYIDALVSAVHESGCTKPVFYNCWGGRAGAAAASTLDGCTFGWYPTGLASGGMLTDNHLGRVNDYPDMRDPRLDHMAKIVYEFDAADVPYPYMYPAMVRAFRSGGAQIATQFQYEVSAIADANPNWQTHYLNLCYTPGKAVSFAIAAEVMRRIPRLARFGEYPESCRFGDFRVSYEERLSELCARDAFLYSNTTSTQPPSLAALTRIAGCGSSPVVSYDGTGAYFLDRLEPGLWKLQLYPDVVMVADPYMGGANEKMRCLWRPRTLTVDLPDLGADFRFIPCDASRVPQPQLAQGGKAATLAPGEYLLATAQAELPARMPGVEFVPAPPSDAPTSAFVHGDESGREGYPLHFLATVASARSVSCELEWWRDGETATRRVAMQAAGPYEFEATIPAAGVQAGKLWYRVAATSGGETLWFPGGLPATDGEDLPAPAAPLLLMDNAPGAPLPEVKNSLPEGFPQSVRFVEGSAPESRAVRLEAPQGFGPPPSCLGAEVKVAARPAAADRYNAVTFMVRGETDSSLVEISLVQDDGTGFGLNVPVNPGWSEYTVPLRDLKPMWGTQATALDLARLDHLTLIFGSWLYGDLSQRPHAVEVQQVKLIEQPAAWPLEVVAHDSPLVLMDGARCRRSTEGRWAVLSTVAGMDPGRRALRIAVDSFPGTDCTSLRLPVPTDLRQLRDEMARARYLLIKARAGRTVTNRVEIVVIEADGSPWGRMDLALTDQWQAFKIPLDELLYFRHWNIGPAGRGGPGDRIRPEDVLAVNICFGSWLFPETAMEPHAVEIQEVSLVGE